VFRNKKYLNPPLVIAVLDWEISTIGDPRADLAYNAMPYYVPDMDGRGLGGSVSGIPLEQEYLAQYCLHTGNLTGITAWGWHVAFAIFRMSAIAAGVYKRSLQGNASDGDAAKRFGAMPASLSMLALKLGKEWHNTTVGALSSASSSASGGMPTNLRLLHDPHAAWFNNPKNRSAYSNESLRQTSSLFPMISQRALDVLCKVNDFLNEHVFPAEGEYVRHHSAPGGNPWTPLPVIERLKVMAKAQGLWNLFLPSVGKFTNLEYARMSEIMGQIPWSSEVFNCSAPDTGNMEILHLFATPAQKQKWLEPLLDGTIRSCFAMTEPDVVSCYQQLRKGGGFHVCVNCFCTGL
jgi:hypothetical protein